MKNSNRRDFLKRSTAVTAAASFTPYLFSSAQPAYAQAASDRLQIGCIGVGSMGQGDAGDFSNLGDVVAVCDVDSEYGISSAQNNPGIGKKVNGQKVGKPDGYKDYREVLDRKDIDVVSIVTVDHWHVKIAVEALMAGKHVFCQKPLTLTVEEGQLIRNACKKYNNLVFQVGTQQRSQKDQFATATLMVRKGMLGDIRKMTVDVGGGDVGGPFKKEAPPECLDWEMWQGQTPRVDYIKERVRYQFRWWYEYGGGKFTDWGAHHIDCAQWALNQCKEGDGPVSFNPLVAEHPVPFKNGYPTQDDRYNTSHRFEISCKFANDVEMLVVNQSRGPNGNLIDRNGILIEGTRGRIHVNRERITGRPFEDGLHKQLTDDDFKELFNGKDFDGWHKRNFVTCIKEGGLPVSDVYSHVIAMNSCHLCAIAARLGREIKWDPKTESIIGDAEAAKFLARERTKGYEIPKV
ncbi:MAG: Gfo/Idh/MocA family oxidoreductase [Planctomycetaceae bacterium]|nr:Gfo/Idh/MocA family oxidoreductase [Planctomycetaceae bacterium]